MDNTARRPRLNSRLYSFDPDPLIRSLASEFEDVPTRPGIFQRSLERGHGVMPAVEAALEDLDLLR